MATWSKKKTNLICPLFFKQIDLANALEEEFFPQSIHMKEFLWSTKSTQVPRDGLQYLTLCIFLEVLLKLVQIEYVQVHTL